MSKAIKLRSFRVPRDIYDDLELSSFFIFFKIFDIMPPDMVQRALGYLNSKYGK